MKPTDGSLDPTLVADPAPSSPRGETRADTVATTGGGDRSGDRISSDPPSGYQLGDLIGRGGMGEVVLADDLQLERKVAIKRMRGDQSTDQAVVRFVREAKIQARLDHPAIVPVYALGHDDAGRPYFTMKRLAGTTLAATIAGGRATPQTLLRALIDVCLAIDFAHARGVIHRDLKPSNIMLGDYGEVYVLDWGVARVAGDQERGGDGAPEEGQTQVGAVLGTPGYISPEQARGEPITAAADVYSLGTILFEILAGEPAHPPGTAGLTSTLTRPVVSPIERRPDRAIAPELDAACVDALAEAPSARPSPRELADRIQRYLDGDRDTGRRRVLAAEQLAIARAAIATNDPARRGAAMSAAGRALALDPESTEAASLVTQLMLEPPRELPAPLTKRLADVDLETIMRMGRSMAVAMSAYFLFLPLVVWAGVRDWRIFVAGFALVCIEVIGGLMIATGRTRQILWAFVANSVLLILFSRVASPFVLIPGLAGGAAVAWIAFPTLIHRPWIAITSTLASFLVPLALEAAGLWEPTWELSGGKLVISSSAVNLDGAPAVVLLVLANVATLLAMTLLVRSLAVAQRAAQRQLEIQAWHLGQLLPVEPPRPASS
jgi:serine/threonine-protein kinase